MHLNFKLLLVTIYIAHYIEESTRIDGKVIKIRNGIAKGVCLYYQNYFKTTQIQPPLRNPPSFSKTENTEAQCGFLKWEIICEKTNSARCSKFNCVSPQEGQLPKSRKSSRIFGGTATKPHEFPHLVSIMSMGDLSYRCAGTIINANIIVTAASCFMTPSAAQYLIYAGKHNLSKDESSEQKIVVKSITTHEDFPHRMFSVNDIALLELKQPLNFTSEVQPALLPSPIWVPTPNYILAGWGMDGTHVGILKVPSKITVQIVPLEECRQIYASDAYISIIRDADTVLCAGNKGVLGEGACFYDEGAPLGFLLTNGSFVLVGFVSSLGHGCSSPGYPTIYTDVSKYIGWIHNNTDRKPNSA